jgi:hypothetical protein
VERLHRVLLLVRPSARVAGAPGGQAAGGAWRSALRADSLRCSVAWPCRRTRFAHCVRCAQTGAASQITRRAARAGHTPWPVQAAPGQWPGRSPGTGSPLDCPCPGSPSRRQADARRQPPGHTCAENRGGPRREAHALQRGRRWVGEGHQGGGEQRRAGVGARSALRDLTCGACLSAESEANAASCAARPRTEQRSAVAACGDHPLWPSPTHRLPSRSTHRLPSRSTAHVTAATTSPRA